jgi:hypothetical protein
VVNCPLPKFEHGNIKPIQCFFCKFSFIELVAPTK